MNLFLSLYSVSILTSFHPIFELMGSMCFEFAH